jgi:hypothetical protein
MKLGFREIRSGLKCHNGSVRGCVSSNIELFDSVVTYS